MYLAAWYGDGEIYAAPDTIGLLGPLGYFDDLTGNTDRLASIRWMQTEMQSGGPDQLLYRMSTGPATPTSRSSTSCSSTLRATPASIPAPTCPWNTSPRASAASSPAPAGTEDAAWFTWALGWNAVDHQHGDGNQIEFYRRGEWLTKERTGYGFNIGSSDYHNTLALQNDQPDHFDPSDYRYDLSLRGSQWMIVAAGDPEILALDLADDVRLRPRRRHQPLQLRRRTLDRHH